MPLIDWNDQLSVQVKHIDTQHKRWIELINNLHDAMKAGQAKDKVADILAAVVDYTKTHFAEEERMMQTNGYPAFLTHKVLHDTLTKEVFKLQQDYREGKTVLTMEVMQFLKTWLTNHIQGVDKQYSSFFNAKGIQ